MDETNREEKFRILDHVASCPACDREFRALLEIRKKGEAVLSACPAGLAVQDARETATEQYRKIKTGNRGRFLAAPLPRKIMAFAGASAVLVMSILTFRSSTNRKSQEIEREIAPWEVRLVSPRANVSSPFFFKWTPVESARSYDLEVLDSTLRPVFAVPRVMSPNYLLSREESTALRPGRIYFWKVTATLESLQRVESNLAKFTVKSE